ncbi:hypothetical protein CIB48_g6281 [Xylaria polymorpha]|nr:hypothetical protein CIB48_g6281 [Xylaria polymorpha]
MPFFPQPPEPEALGVHRVMSPTAGMLVSPLCLGTMGFGDAWPELLGDCSKEEAFKVLDYFKEHGGNFIDTANNYQNELSETWLGEWLESRDVRDEMVIATKYSNGYRFYEKGVIQGSFTGNSTKSLHTSVKASLKKLRTDYIDILYVHWFDFTTSIEEVMQSLNQLVQSGKVLYLGISDTPAWVVSRANEYARQNGMRGFSIYQGHWSCAARDFERDIIPMCKAEGMALAPWGSLGGGYFKTDSERTVKDQQNTGRNIPVMDTSNHAKVGKVLQEIGRIKGVAMTTVALAYVMHKAPYVFPVIGCRKLEYLKANLEALNLELTPQDMEMIENAAPFDIGFPMWFNGCANPANNLLLHNTGHYDYVQDPKPIAPRKKRETDGGKASNGVNGA